MSDDLAALLLVLANEDAELREQLARPQPRRRRLRTRSRGSARRCSPSAAVSPPPIAPGPGTSTERDRHKAAAGTASPCAGLQSRCGERSEPTARSGEPVHQAVRGGDAPADPHARLVVGFLVSPNDVDLADA